MRKNLQSLCAVTS